MSSKMRMSGVGGLRADLEVRTVVSRCCLVMMMVQCVISLNTRAHQNAVPDFSGIGKGKLKYVWGDALADPKAVGPDGNAYPWELASKIASKQRNPRTMFAEEIGGADIGLINPETTRQILLKSFEAQEFGGGISSFFGSLSHSHHHHHPHTQTEEEGTTSRKSRVYGESPTTSGREGKAYTIRGRGNKRVGNNPMQYHHAFKSDLPESTPTTTPHNDGEESTSPGPEMGSGMQMSDGGCVPSRLCPSTYNTTAPLYGISLTSGQPVTIVQKFPDLLQQVVFQVCKTTECDVIHGECVQTYLPYLFLVIPLGPVTLTGQDYVLVESGCVCRPKYASKQDEPPPLPFIQAYNTTRARTQG